MKSLQRTLAILACLFLTVQTVRHVYYLWLAPRTSVLQKYEQPLAGEIGAATTLDELLRRYDPIRKDADRLRAKAGAASPDRPIDEYNAEPFKSERLLQEAIITWEDRSKQINALRFFWFVGLVFALLGSVCYRRVNRWFGVTFVIIGMSEMIYWTSPEIMSLIPGGAHEFDRLLANKLGFSIASLAVLALVIWQLAVFEEQPRTVEQARVN